MELKRDSGGYICPYNDKCRCEDLKCSKCGWNPKVDEKRRKKLRNGSGKQEV